MNEDTRYVHIHLPSSGAIAGIPGSHAPGDYVIDWQERTIAPFGQSAPEASPGTAEDTTEKVPALAKPEPPTEQPAEPAKPDVSAEITHLEEELHQIAADAQ